MSITNYLLWTGSLCTSKGGIKEVDCPGCTKTLAHYCRYYYIFYNIESGPLKRIAKDDEWFPIIHKRFTHYNTGCQACLWEIKLQDNPKTPLKIQVRAYSNSSNKHILILERYFNNYNFLYILNAAYFSVFSLKITGLVLVNNRPNENNRHFIS